MPGSPPDDVELELEKLFQREPAAGQLRLIQRFRKMRHFQRGRSRLVSVHFVVQREGVRIALQQQQMDDFPQPPLGDSGDVFVNGNNPFEMDRGIIIALPDDFEFRMIDDEPSVGILHFSINDHLVSRCHEFLDERHVEPAAGHFSRTEHPTRTVHDDHFVKAPAGPEVFESGIDHRAAKADRIRGWLVRKSIEPAAVLVAFRQMVEKLCRRMEPRGSQRHDFPLRKKR